MSTILNRLKKTNNNNNNNNQKKQAVVNKLKEEYQSLEAKMQLAERDLLLTNYENESLTTTITTTVAANLNSVTTSTTNDTTRITNKLRKFIDSKLPSSSSSSLTKVVYVFMSLLFIILDKMNELIENKKKDK